MSDAGADREEPSGVEWGGLPSPELLRATLGLAAGIGLAVLGGLALGEFQFVGAVPYVTGVLFGLVIGELVVEIGRRRTLPIAVVSGVAAAGGLVLAGWISAGAGPYPALALVAAGLALVAAVARIWDRVSDRGAGRRARTSSRPAP